MIMMILHCVYMWKTAAVQETCTLHDAHITTLYNLEREYNVPNSSTKYKYYIPIHILSTCISASCNRKHLLHTSSCTYWQY